VKVVEGYSDHRLGQSLSALWADTGKKSFFTRIDKLLKAKNDMKHDRGPKNEEELAEATDGVGGLLTDCMQDLAFLTEHPIRLVRDMDVARGTRSVVLHTLRCEGDHPGFPQERIGYPEPLTKNDLYIEVEPGHWVPLFPFVVPRNCPTCKTREIYFVDRWPGKGCPALRRASNEGIRWRATKSARGLKFGRMHHRPVIRTKQGVERTALGGVACVGCAPAETGLKMPKNICFWAA